MLQHGSCSSCDCAACIPEPLTLSRPRTAVCCCRSADEAQFCPLHAHAVVRLSRGRGMSFSTFASSLAGTYHAAQWCWCACMELCQCMQVYGRVCQVPSADRLGLPRRPMVSSMCKKSQYPAYHCRLNLGPKYALIGHHSVLSRRPRLNDNHFH